MDIWPLSARMSKSSWRHGLSTTSAGGSVGIGPPQDIVRPAERTNADPPDPPRTSVWESIVRQFTLWITYFDVIPGQPAWLRFDTAQSLIPGAALS